MKKFDPLPEDIVTYCLTHAAKCDDEGLHVRRIVLDTAAQEILNLRSRIKDLEQILYHSDVEESKDEYSSYGKEQ